MSEFQGTALEELVKNVILSLSGAGAGLVVYLASINTKMAFRQDGWKRRLNAAYAMARFGFVGVLALVAEAVFRANAPIPVEWRTLLYTACLLMATLGYAGVVFETRKLPPSDGLRTHVDSPRDPRDPRGPADARDIRDIRRADDPRDERDPRLPGDPRDEKE